MKLLFTLLSISAAIIIIFMLKKMKFTQIFLSVASGISALFCCDVILSFFGNMSLVINPYTLSISAVGGIPGVILLLLLDMLR